MHCTWRSHANPPIKRWPLRRGSSPPTATATANTAESRTQSPTGVVFALRDSGFLRGLWRDLREGVVILRDNSRLKVFIQHNNT